MPKMPIPDDWNGEDWRAICIHWPDSVQWRALLRGLISTPARGRFWDDRAGNIRDTQEIGKTIIDSNFDFPACVEGSTGMIAYEKYWRLVLNRDMGALSTGLHSRHWDVMLEGQEDEDLEIYDSGTLPVFTTVILQPGEYHARWVIAGYRVGYYQSRIRRTNLDGSSAVTINRGTLVRADEALRNEYSEGIADFILSVPQAVYIDWYVANSSNPSEGQVAVGGTDYTGYAGTWEIWKKANLDVVGPPGQPGPQGAQGAQGATGEDGPGVIMRALGSELQWAQEDDPETWFDLIDICDLNCEEPDEPIVEIPEDACLNAIGIMWAFQNHLHYLWDAAEQTETFVEYWGATMGAFFTFVGSFAGGYALSLMLAAYETWKSDIPGWYGAVEQEQWDEFKCYWYDAIVTENGLNGNSKELVENWANGRADDYLNLPLYNFWKWIAQTTEQIKVSGLSIWIGQFGDTITGECDCGQQQILWLANVLFDGITQQTFDEMGFAINPAGAGELVPSIGVVAHNSGAPNYVVNLGLRAFVPALSGQEDTFIHYIALEFVHPHPATFENMYGYDKAWNWVLVGTPHPPYVTWAEFEAGGVLDEVQYHRIFMRDYSAAPLLLVKLTSPDVAFNIVLQDGEIEPGQNLILHAVRVWGTGYNPFAAAGWFNAIPVPPPTGPFA